MSRLIDNRDCTDMYDTWRRRNLIESGKYTEEEVDEHPDEWKHCKDIKKTNEAANSLLY